MCLWPADADSRGLKSRSLLANAILAAYARVHELWGTMPSLCDDSAVTFYWTISKDCPLNPARPLPGRLPNRGSSVAPTSTELAVPVAMIPCPVFSDIHARRVRPRTAFTHPPQRALHIHAAWLESAPALAMAHEMCCLGRQTDDFCAIKLTASCHPALCQTVHEAMPVRTMRTASGGHNFVSLSIHSSG